MEHDDQDAHTSQAARTNATLQKAVQDTLSADMHSLGRKTVDR